VTARAEIAASDDACVDGRSRDARATKLSGACLFGPDARGRDMP
jgi:hypothetical protein